MGKQIEYTLEAVNQRLRDGRHKAKIYPRGNMLWLQATLPPRPGDSRPKPYQQKIRLGLTANEEGFRQAEGEAKLLGSLLTTGKFDWSQYLDPERLPENKPARLLIEEFKQHYMQTHSLQESTWNNDWNKIYKRLSPDLPLSVESLKEIVDRTHRNTRNRKETCRKLQALANFAGLKVDLLQYKGDYGASKVEDLAIPSDKEIALWRGKIPNPAWQWVYGVMAAYGLRDHEVFFCKFTDEGLHVLKGKTGKRLVYEPLYKEWVEEWDLKSIKLPNIQNIDYLYEIQKLGDKVARQFRRYSIPFPPYALRHAYGIRASLTFGLPVTVGADLMGHSPKIHLERYHKHVQRRQNQEAAQRIMERPDRPKPPSV